MAAEPGLDGARLRAIRELKGISTLLPRAVVEPLGHRPLHGLTVSRGAEQTTWRRCLSRPRVGVTQGNRGRLIRVPGPLTLSKTQEFSRSRRICSNKSQRAMEPATSDPAVDPVGGAPAAASDPARSESYCSHQRYAVRLICLRCQKPYDVTNRDPALPFVCVWCTKGSASDVHGVPMEGGATGP